MGFAVGLFVAAVVIVAVVIAQPELLPAAAITVEQVHIGLETVILASFAGGPAMFGSVVVGLSAVTDNGTACAPANANTPQSSISTSTPETTTINSSPLPATASIAAGTSNALGIPNQEGGTVYNAQTGQWQAPSSTPGSIGIAGNVAASPTESNIGGTIVDQGWAGYSY
jgi:hypothetical protein